MILESKLRIYIHSERKWPWLESIIHMHHSSDASVIRKSKTQTVLLVASAKPGTIMLKHKNISRRPYNRTEVQVESVLQEARVMKSFEGSRKSNVFLRQSIIRLPALPRALERLP